MTARTFTEDEAININNFSILLKLAKQLWGEECTSRGPEYTFGDKASINVRTGYWFDFTNGRGGGTRELMRLVEMAQLGAQQELQLYQYDPDRAQEPLKWVVENLIPEVGAGLLGGQWGTLKTFVLCDLAAALINGTTFIDYPIMRKGGVVFVAAEGGSFIEQRFRAAIKERTHDDPQSAPFFFLKECPPLLGQDAAEKLIEKVKQAHDVCMQQFQLPIVLVGIDTITASAAYEAQGENETGTIQRIMTVLHKLGAATGSFALGVDHQGKDVSAGLRGSISKEDRSDVILLTLGDREVSGAVRNTRLAVRKVKEADHGRQIAFSKRIVNIEPAGTTLVIDWHPTATVQTARRERDPWNAGKGMRTFRTAFNAARREHGIAWPEAEELRAVLTQHVKQGFYAIYPMSNEDTDADPAHRLLVAFKRAFSQALEGGLIKKAQTSDGEIIWQPPQPI